MFFLLAAAIAAVDVFEKSCVQETETVCEDS